MKLKNPGESNLVSHLIPVLKLVIICIISLFLIATMSCLVGSIVIYFEHGAFFFDWRKDIFYCLKMGVVYGILAAVSVLIKNGLQCRAGRKTNK